MMPQNLLVIGATGVIGKYITDALLNAKSHFGRIAIFTSSGTLSKKATDLEGLRARGVEILTGDLRSEGDIKKAYEGIDTVISCVGRAVIDAQIPLIQWASEIPSVRRFFPSEYGTDIEYGPNSPTEKPHQQKLKVRAHMNAVARDRLEYTYLVTGPYSDLYFGPPMAAAPRAGGFDVQGKKATLLGDGKGRVSFTSMGDVGKLVVAALLHPEASRNQTLIVNSFTTCPDEILAEFEKQTGGGKWDVRYTSLEKLRELEQQAWRDGSPIAALFTVRRIWTEGGTLYDKRDNGLIGDPEMESLADQVRLAVRNQSL